MSESEMNLDLPSSSPTPSTPSSSQPPSQVHPITSEIYTRYPPKIARRMQEDKCYKCQQKGHWAWDCPLKSPNVKSLSPSAKDHGSCAHRVSEDELLKNKSIVPIRKSMQRTLDDLWEDLQHDKTDDALVKEDYLLEKHSKRMRIMENPESNSENPSSIAVSVPAKEEGPAPTATPSKGASSSFNPIDDVPKQVSIGEGPCKSSQLADNSLSQQTQISIGCDIEVSRDAVIPNKSPATERKPMSKAERRRQIVLVAQQQLLIDLETFDPNGQREAAEATFGMLDNLGVNYKQFAEHVWDYIDLASSMAEMDKSMENSLTLDEYNKCFEEEKERYARVQGDCFNTETLLEASNHRRQSLIEEISHLEAMLNEKQTQLKSCELEKLQIETHLGDLRKSLMEAETTFKVTAEEATKARQLNEEREAKKISAKTALEKAKLEFEN